MDTPNRRDFIVTAGAAAAAAAMGPVTMATPRRKNPLEMLNIGIVGTGGRGTGACNDTLTANKDVRLVAMSDLNMQKCQSARDNLAKAHGDRVAVEDSKMHGGLDGYLEVINDPNVDLVLLTTSPGFRPQHVEEAVKAKKHVFAEKPVCIDPAGYRACRNAHAMAEEQGTAIVTGTQYRRQDNYVDAIRMIHEGVIGEPVTATGRYCGTGIWYRPRQEGQTDAEYQLNNWMHFIWLSGDQIAEQAVHNIDVMNWAMNSTPERAFGSGGRFTRPDDSEMWDSMSVDYDYPGGKLVSFMCRQLPDATVDVDNVIYCTEGTCYIKAINGGSRIVDKNGREIYSAPGNIGAAYRQEHKDLVESIKAGSPIVELNQTADSSLTAAMGRMASYTGKEVTWEFVTEKSKLDTFPKDLTLESSLPSNGYAVPGTTKLT